LNTNPYFSKEVISIKNDIIQSLEQKIFQKKAFHVILEFQSKLENNPNFSSGAEDG